MKTSSIIQKSLNKSFQTLYTFLGDPNMFTLYNVCSVHQGMFTTSRGLQFLGGCHEYIRGDTMSTSGGYHEYIGGCSVHQKDTMSISGDVQYIGGIP